jgi:hypothetical protein
VLSFYRANPNAAREGKVSEKAVQRTNGINVVTGSHANERTNVRSKSQEVRSHALEEKSKIPSRVAKIVDPDSEEEIRQPRSGPSRVAARQVSESDDDIVLLPQGKAALTPKANAVNGKSSPVKSSPAVTGIAKAKGGILGYFSLFDKKKGKENEEVPAARKVVKEVKEVKRVEKVAPKLATKKRRPDPDDSGSDFVHESEPDEAGSDDLVSEEEEEEDADVEEDDDEEEDGEFECTPDVSDKSTETQKEPWMEQGQGHCSCQTGNSQCVSKRMASLTAVPHSTPVSPRYVKRPT